MNKLNEDFTKLYLRWKGGEVRKEDKIDKNLVEKFVKDSELDMNDVTINDGDVDFDCDINIIHKDDLTFKIGHVYGDFNAGQIDLDSLNFFPKFVNGDFNISENYLESFEGCPMEVGGNFTATDCRKLTSLKGLPKYIGGNLLLTTPNRNDSFTEDDIPEGCKIDGYTKFKLRNKHR